MQSLLMVAALECSRDSYGQDMRYDDFIRTNRTSLVGYNDAIKFYYARAYGPVEGRAAYDRFTTALANRHANSAATNTGFCRSAASLLRLANEARPGELVALASDVEERPFGVGESCEEARQIAPMPAAEPLYPAVEPAPLMADDTRGYSDAVAVRPEPEFGDTHAYREIAPPMAEPLPAIVAAPVAQERAPMVMPVAAPIVEAVATGPETLPVAVAGSVSAPPSPSPAISHVAAIAAPASPSPAAALAAAAQALQAAAEALRASAVSEAPSDSAPVIRERLPARKS